MSVVIDIHGCRKTLLPVGHTLTRRLKLAGDGGPWVYAEVGVVHAHGCAASLRGRRHGLCDCGGDAMLREVVIGGPRV
jgi:hypothetical protein